MSVTISNPSQICNSPINNSRAKMLWSFPKNSKEIYVKKSDCNQAFYDLPSSKSTRTAGFGYGTKMDFTKSVQNNPPPNTYEIKSAFDSKKKGKSFGLSREAMHITGGSFVGDKNSPGPGAYDVRERGKTKISFSFRPRTTSEALTSPKFVPGPGTYPVLETISPKGKYNVSKYKGSGATLIAPARSQRFTDLKPGFPGPGTYEPGTTISKDGSYFVSKFQASLCRTFSHSMRKNASMANVSSTPGPGSYRLPSDFGHYESAKTQKTKGSNLGNKSVQGNKEEKAEI